MSRAPVEVSVVIPAFEEEARIRAAIAETAGYFDGRGESFEIIVADDGSSDGTAGAVRRAAEEQPFVELVSPGVHRGKGAAVRAGLSKAMGARVLVVDADLAIPLSEYPAFDEALSAGADVAIASKELGRRAGRVRQSLLRRAMGRAFNLAVRALVLPGICDTQAGFKLFRGTAARLLAGLSRVDGFAYDVELLALARIEGMKIAELPVACTTSGPTSVRVFADSHRMFIDLLGIRRRLGRPRPAKEGRRA